jgi:hypothetical protein
MPQTKPVTNPRVAKLIELETAGRIKPEHQTELDSYRARGLATGPKPLTEAEGKTTSFYSRLRGADTDFEGTKAAEEPRGVLAQMAATVLPTGVVNSFTGADRQKSEQAKRDWIDASLRYESGAAIGKDEFDRQDQMFFPQPGDTPEVIDQKAQARLRVIEGFRVAGGMGVRQLDRREDGRQFEALNIDNATDYALGLRDKKPGEPQQGPNGSIRVLMPDGSFSTYPNREAYDRASVEDQLAAVFGGDRNSEGYRAAYKARFGEDAPIDVEIGGPAKPKTIDLGDGATGAFARGMGDTATFGGIDELGGVIDTLAGDGGEGSFTDRLGRNITRNRQVLAGDAENHPYARFSGQLVGGAAIPFGAGARTVGQYARLGAATGTAYGVGSAEGDIGDRVAGGVKGALTGTVGGVVVGASAPHVAGALSRLATPPAAAAERSAIREAAERQQIPLIAADVRPGARNATAFLEASPGSSGRVQRSVEAGANATADAVARLGGAGTARTADEIGGIVQDAGRRAIGWSRQRKDNLYDNAARLAGGTTVRSDNAVQALDQSIAELAQTPNANRGILGLLNDMRGDLVDANGQVRALSVDAIRQLRTAMRGEIGTRNLTMTDAERRVSQVIDAASADITTALRATNPRAADAYARADRFYRQRQEYIGDIVQRFTGPRDRPLSGEKAFQQIMTMAGPRGDRRRLVEMMRALSPEERSDVAATIAGQLGRRTPEEDFSPALFVSHAAKLTPGARVAIFGQEGADAVADIVRIATAKRDAGNMINRSRSGQVGNYDRVLSGALGLLGAGGGYAAGGVPGAALGAVTLGAAKAGALNISARVLTNPGFARWLSRAPRAGGAPQVTAHVQQLSRLAATQPIIRAEIEQLQRYLSTTGVSRTMASEGRESDQEQRNRREPVAASR